jgi:hypothetical protein
MFIARFLWVEGLDLCSKITLGGSIGLVPSFFWVEGLDLLFPNYFWVEALDVRAKFLWV